MADKKDALDKLVKDVTAHERKVKITRTARTHRLAEPNYTILRKYCEAKGKPVQEVIDGLIEAFIERVQDDPDMTKIQLVENVLKKE